MGRRSLLLAPVVWLLVAHAAALYLFTTGFFLTRFEVPDVSECRVRPAAPAHQNLRRDLDTDSAPRPTATDECWLPARFRRVVFVVVDALRFDFVRSSSSAASPPSSSSSSSFYYLDRLQVLNETLSTRPSNSLLFKFVADPPTMTMQRLKGLMTGSLPTFLDIKDNMASSSAIAEDNLLRQMRAQGRGIVFMGDDTWDALYGDAFFTRKYAFDSFNVKDLDSVDNGVKRHLFPELVRDDWDLLIAHFLGVDHVGHTHGPSSVFMTQKLDEMNRVLGDLLEALPDDDTLLAVLGDHGMSADGNHGGASDEETGAALFLYSKQPIVADEFRPYAERWSSEVPQVDLVPTLALLSGLPIPFGNLGSVIPLLFFSPLPGREGSTPTKDDMQDENQDDRKRRLLASFESLTAALQLNVEQVRRYLWTYSSASKLPTQAYDALEHMLVEIDDVREQLNRLGADTLTPPSALSRKIELLGDLASRQQRYLREALALGRSIWTQFDLCSMAWGFLLLTWSLLLLVIDCLNPGVSVIGNQMGSSIASTAKAAVVVIAAGGVSVLSALFVLGTHPLTRWLPVSPLSRALAVIVLLGLTHASLRAWHLRRQMRSVAGFIGGADSVRVVAFVVVLLHALALLSNSYIVAEDKVMTFLSETIGFFLLCHTQRPGSATGLRKARTFASVLFIASSRLASAVEPPNIIQSTPSLVRTYAPVVVMVVMASVFAGFFKSRGCIVSLSDRFPSLLVGFAVNCAICAVYWGAAPIASTLLRLWLPRTVYLSFLAHLVVFWWRNRRGEDTTGLLLTLFWQFVPCYMLVLGPSSPVSVLCSSLQLLSFAFVAQTSLHAPSKPAGLTGTSGARPAWVLLFASVAYHAFFFTGHQNTFTSLQNAAGFVGFDEFQFYAAGVLLGLNTFGNYALALLALPWLLVAGRSSQVAAWRAALLAFLAFFALNAAVSTAFVALQRRHLMVWAIFAPKFLFDGVALLVADVLALLLLAPRSFAVQ